MVLSFFDVVLIEYLFYQGFLVCLIMLQKWQFDEVIQRGEIVCILNFMF